MREGVRCCHTSTRCCGKVTVVVETVVKQLYSIRINIAHVRCADRRLAGHCGNTVKNHGADVVLCNKKVPNTKGTRNNLIPVSRKQTLT